jgi:hypothetical protein
MKKIALAIFALFAFQLTFSQESELLMDTELVSSPDAFNPKFEGGSVLKFYDFVNREFNFSKVTKSGKMVASFTVDADGSIKEIKVLEFPEVSAAAEIIRVLNKSPKWEPALRNGKPFSTTVKLPLIFKEKVKREEKPIIINDSDLEPEKNAVVIDSILENRNKDLSSTSSEPKKNFSGGIGKFYTYVMQHFRLPEDEDISGKIIVSFVVEIDGSLSDIHIIKDLGYGTGKQIIDILKKSPKWKPGIQNGKPVRVMYNLPIVIAREK